MSDEEHKLDMEDFKLKDPMGFTPSQRLSFVVVCVIGALVFGVAVGILYNMQQAQVEKVHNLAVAIQNDRYHSCIMNNEHHHNIESVVQTLLEQQVAKLPASQRKSAEARALKQAQLEINALAPLRNCTALTKVPPEKKLEEHRGR